MFDVVVLGVLAILIMFLFSCRHEPLSPVTVANDNTNSGNGGGSGTDTTTYPEVSCDPDSVYFTNTILPLFISNCAKSGCHDAATHQEGIVLNSYASIMASDEIEPGDPSEGDIMEAITENDPDKIMPPPPNTPLTGAQINLISDWIAQGAVNNSCTDGCDTSNVTYSGTVVPILQLRCVGCHNSNTTSDNINLTLYSGVELVASNGRLLGAINHAAGFTPMPLSGPKLPQCDIDKIRIWVEDGAPNN